jgi:hypothetical protein
VRAAALAVVVASALAGCGGDGDDAEQGGTSVTPSPTTAEDQTTTTVPTPTTSTGETGTTAPSGRMVVQVFFLDENAFNLARPPYVVPVEREVDAASPARGALDALFAGPTAEEASAGLTFVASGATGIADVRIEAGTAHVTLAGGCSSAGSTFTIADEIFATLRQFETVDSVRIYDPAGTTGSDRPGDSIPFCLEP